MERTVAKCLLEIKAINFGFDKEFLSPQGHRTPLYCDNRLIFIYPRVRKVLSKWLTNLVNMQYSDAELIVGTTIPGISLGVLLSESLGIPITYTLNSKGGTVDISAELEEAIQPGVKVLIIDDVIYTGNTIANTVQYLKNINCTIIGAISVFSYELDETKARMEKLGIDYSALTNFDVVSMIGMQTGKITYPEYLKLKGFKQKPFCNDWLK